MYLDPSLPYCFLTAFHFFLHFLIPLITVRTCCLQLWEGLGGWNLFPTNKKLGKQKIIFYQGRYHRILLSFNMAHAHGTKEIKNFQRNFSIGPIIKQSFASAILNKLKQL